MGVSVLEYLEAGKIDLLDVGIIGYLSLKADGAGVAEIHALYPQVSSRTLLRRLGRLEQIGLAKASKTPGKKGLYAALSWRASLCDTVGDANGITGETATACNGPAGDTVDGLGGDVSERRPPENCPENPDNEGQASATPAPASPLDSMGITLPARHHDFVLLIAEHPRRPGEGFLDWCQRMIAQSNERSIFLPRPFYAKFKNAAA